MCNYKTTIIVVGTLLSICGFAFAEAVVSFKLKDPQWEFILNNKLFGETTAQLTSNESSFAGEIQPLLASQNYSAVLNVFAERNMDDDSAALRLLRGQILLSMNKFAEAEKALKSALSLMPDLALAHRSLSMLYMLDKQYQQARLHLAQSIELGVADAQVYGQLAFVNLQLGQAASAVAGYQYALLIDTENNQWRQGLLYALTKTQAFSQAQALLEEMLQDDLSNSELWLQRGQLALKQQNYLSAIGSLETALVLGEKNSENIATAAQLHIQTGSPQRAVTLLADNMPMFIQPRSSNLAVVEQLAEWLVFQQDWVGLEALLKAVVKNNEFIDNNNQSKFSVFSAQLALSNHDLNDANKHLEQAVKADPSNGDALINLAALLTKMQKTERALMLYVRAEALSSFKERALLGKAQLEIERHNYAQALAALQLVYQLNPTRSDVKANIQSLENLIRNQS